jgi:hypothetical protein
VRKSRAARRRFVNNVALGIAALGVFVSAVAGAGYYLYTRDPGLDRHTLCPRSGPLGHTVLLVDKTDPLNFGQKQAFLRLLEELVERRIHLRAGAQPLVELCNPGSGEGKSVLTANVAKLDLQFRDRFREPLLKQADALVSTTPARNSPLLEMFQLVSINGFRKHAVNGVRRLIVVSDLLHKTPQYSMYQGIVAFDSFATTEYGRKMVAELPAVEVEVHQVLHYPKLQTPRQLEFWSAYFERMGARVVVVRPLEG